MSKHRVLINYFYNTSYQLLLIILPLVTAPYVSRKLGAVNIGAYSYTQSIVAYFILFGCMGLNIYGQRECAYNQSNCEKRSHLFFEIIFLKIIMVSISLIPYAYIITISTKYKIFYLIQLLELIASSVDITWFFQGLEEFKKITIRNFIIKLLSVAAVFIFINKRNDIYIYVFIYSISIVISNISMWLFLPKFIEIKYLRGLNIKKHFKPACILFLPQIATSIYTVLDKTMIGFITNSDSQVAYYEQAQKIVKMALTLVTSMGTVMLSRIAFCFSNKKIGEIKNAIYNSFKFACFLSFPLCVGLMTIASNFIPWFFGKEFLGATANMILISPILVLISLSNVIGNQYLLPTKQQKKYTLSVVIGSLVNFLCNLVLIHLYSSVGASLATVISEFSVTLIQLYMVRNEFKVLRILQNSKNYICGSVLMGIGVWGIGNVPINYILVTFLQIGCGGLIYIGYLVCRKDDILIQIRQHM